MKSGYFVLRCCDCDKELLITSIPREKKIENEEMEINFNLGKTGLYCECGNYIEPF